MSVVRLPTLVEMDPAGHVTKLYFCSVWSSGHRRLRATSCHLQAEVCGLPFVFCLINNNIIFVLKILFDRFIKYLCFVVFMTGELTF